MNDKFLKKIAILLLFMGFGSPLFAQIQSAELGVNGLTCSQCSRSVEMKLDKLKFIETITMDLEHTKAVILFKKNTKVDLSAIAKAVRDAGFSVRILTISIDSKKADLGKNCFMINNDAFDIIGASILKTKIVKFQVLGKEFMSKEKSKELNAKLIAEDLGTDTMDSKKLQDVIFFRNPDCIGENTYFIKQVK